MKSCGVLWCCFCTPIDWIAPAYWKYPLLQESRAHSLAWCVASFTWSCTLSLLQRCCNITWQLLPWLRVCQHVLQNILCQTKELLAISYRAGPFSGQPISICPWEKAYSGGTAAEEHSSKVTHNKVTWKHQTVWRSHLDMPKENAAEKSLLQVRQWPASVICQTVLPKEFASS